jgi:hypothetical protein
MWSSENLILPSDMVEGEAVIFHVSEESLFDLHCGKQHRMRS